MIQRFALSVSTSAILFLAGLLLFAGCASTTPMAVTGESLAQVGTQFVAINAAYVDGCDVKKTLTPAQCNNWIAFGTKFKQFYPVAAQAWTVARNTNDAALIGQTSTLVSTLVGQLAAFAAVVGMQVIGGN